MSANAPNPPPAPPPGLVKPRSPLPESLYLLIACMAGQLLLAGVAFFVVGMTTMPDKGVVDVWIGAPALLSLGILIEVLWQREPPGEFGWYFGLISYGLQILLNMLISLPVGLLVPGGPAYLPLLAMEVLLGGLSLVQLSKNRPVIRPTPRPKPVEPEDIETTGDWDEARDPASQSKRPR